MNKRASDNIVDRRIGGVSPAVIEARLEFLEAENARLHKMLQEGWIEVAESGILTYKEENESLRKDAERYRWLRDNVHAVTEKHGLNEDVVWNYNERWQIKPYLIATTCIASLVSFDEAIDQAINKEK